MSDSTEKLEARLVEPIRDTVAHSGETPAPPASALTRLGLWAQRVGLERKLAIAFLITGVVSGTVTFMAMTGNFRVAADPWSLLLLLNLDLVILLVLGVLIARRLVILWTARKRGLAGSQLHARLVALFGLVAVTPTIVVAVFSVLLFDFGLQGWFSDRVRTAVEASFAVAQAYLAEHRRTIETDALAVAQALDREGVSLALNPDRFNQVLARQVGERSLAEALVFDRSGRIVGRAGFSLLLDFDPEIPDWAMRRANEGEVVIITAETDDRVRALLKLQGFTNSYLYVGRLVDPLVLAHIDRTQNAAKLYQELEGKRSDLQITFALIFAVVALLLLLAAVSPDAAYRPADRCGAARRRRRLAGAPRGIRFGGRGRRFGAGLQPDDRGTGQPAPRAPGNQPGARLSHTIYRGRFGWRFRRHHRYGPARADHPGQPFGLQPAIL